MFCIRRMVALAASLALATGTARAGEGQIWIPYQELTQTVVTSDQGDLINAYDAQVLPGVNPPGLAELVVPLIGGVKTSRVLHGWSFAQPLPVDFDFTGDLKCWLHVAHSELREGIRLRWSGSIAGFGTGDVMSAPSYTGGNPSFGNAGPDRLDPLGTAAGGYVRTGPLGWPGPGLSQTATLYRVVFFPTFDNAVNPGHPFFPGTGGPAWMLPPTVATDPIESGATEFIYLLGVECDYTTLEP